VSGRRRTVWVLVASAAAVLAGVIAVLVIPRGTQSTQGTRATQGHARESARARERAVDRAL